MKNFLIERKWVGFGLVVLFSLLIAWVTTTKTSLFLRTITPYVAQEAQSFLPVTIENGTIVEPKDTVISKEYVLRGKNISVVLNTEADELNTDEIKNSGIYFSRKFMYMVTPQKTEIRDLNEFENMTLDQESLDETAKWLEAKSESYLFVSIFIMLLSFFGLAILFYAALTQLLLGKVVNTDFYRTVRITTLAYLILTTIELFSGMPINILIKFVIIVIINYYINKKLYQFEK